MNRSRTIAYMSKSIRHAKRFSLYLFAIGIVLLAYVPVRLLANRTNTTFIAGSDDFYPWSATLLWPFYSFLVSFLPQVVAVMFPIRWYFRVLGAICLFFAWDSLAILDDWFQLTGMGTYGLRAFPSNHPGMNTPHLSVILSPIAFVIGAALAEFSPRPFRRSNDDSPAVA